MSVFNNTAVQQAKSQMSDADLKHFEKLGELVYGDLDIYTSNFNTNKLKLKYIQEIEHMLASGLLESDLTENERTTLESKDELLLALAQDLKGAQPTGI